MRELWRKLLQLLKNLFEAFEPMNYDDTFRPLMPQMKKRKSPDMVEFTQNECKYICSMRTSYDTYNRGKSRRAKMNNDAFTLLMNSTLGRHKSYSSYYQVWSKRINLEELEVGVELFLPSEIL